MPKLMDLGGTRSLTLYHGTDNANLIPRFGFGRKHNDYGQGFYTTPDFNLACEWACGHATEEGRAYVYEYKIDLTNLSLFDFYGIEKLRPVFWISELMQNRLVNGVDRTDALFRFLIDNFSPDTKGADIIKGPRADDSYFSFAKAFVQNRIDVGLLGECLEEGNLGVQYCLKTRKSFEALQPMRRHVLSDSSYDKHRKSYLARDSAARDHVEEMFAATIAGIGKSVTLFRLMELWMEGKEL